MTDDPLERMLAAPMPVDDGFTARVMERLPPARRRVPRALVLGAGSLLGIGVAAMSPASRYLLAAFEGLAGARSLDAVAPTTSAALVGLTFLAVAVGSALQLATQE